MLYPGRHNPGPDIGGVLILGANYFGASNPANILTNNVFAESLDIEFLGPTTVVGLRLGCMTTTNSCAQTVDVSVFGAGNVLLDSTNIAVTDLIDSFLGIVSAANITRINFEFPGGSLFEIKAISDIKVNTSPLQITDVNDGVCVFTKSVTN